MSRHVCLLALVLCSCQGGTGGEGGHPEAQAIVDRIVAANSDLVRLTIHAVPTGQAESRIIASNLPEKIGRPSDPEDIDAMKTGETVVLREGEDLDVTAPVRDEEGRPIAATGITLKVPEDATEDQVVAAAKQIAAELTEAVRNAPKPLW